MSNVAVIILAAGAASRMGQPKQFLPLNGTTLLNRAIGEASASGMSPILVVLGAHQPVSPLPPNVLVVQNPQWQGGIGTSIRAGIQRILSDNDIDAAAIVLCDQPRVTGSHLREMRAAFDSAGKQIVAASYSDTLGPPCIFGRAYFRHLLNLKPEQGAKPVIMQAGDDVFPFTCPDAAIDLDTPDDVVELAKAQRD